MTIRAWKSAGASRRLDPCTTRLSPRRNLILCFSHASGRLRRLLATSPLARGSLSHHVEERLPLRRSRRKKLFSIRRSTAVPVLSGVGAQGHKGCQLFYRLLACSYMSGSWPAFGNYQTSVAGITRHIRRSLSVSSNNISTMNVRLQVSLVTIQAEVR